jgi:hypothetical protein
MHDAPQTKTGLEAIGIVLMLMTFLTVAMATFIVTKDSAELAIAQETSSAPQGSRLTGIFN